MRVVIGMPTANLVDAEFACANLPAIISTSIRKLPDVELKSVFKTGVRTDSNRNWILQQALEAHADYILWLDTDELYPPDILVKLLEPKEDIIGTIYYKRSKPYAPVVFKYNQKENKDISPYTPIDTPFLPKGQLVEVDGLGFGGMLVSTKVYKDMGDDMWMHYGRNFHIPEELPEKLSHDLVFCEKAKKLGYKIYAHTSVVAGHIGRTVITEKDYMNQLDNELNPRITVLMPSIDHKKAEKTITQLESRAGIKATYVILDDPDRKGFVEMVNQGYKKYIDSHYFVYVAEDAFAGQDWLKIAYDTMEEHNAGLFAFNDGKWKGQLASFGMVKKQYLRFLCEGKYLLNPAYHSHYGDTELSVISIAHGKMIYNPNAVLIEVDYKKHGVNKKDKKTFARRKKDGFDGRVKDPMYLNMFE